MPKSENDFTPTIKNNKKRPQKVRSVLRSVFLISFGWHDIHTSKVLAAPSKTSTAWGRFFVGGRDNPIGPVLIFSRRCFDKHFLISINPTTDKHKPLNKETTDTIVLTWNFFLSHRTKITVQTKHENEAFPTKHFFAAHFILTNHHIKYYSENSFCEVYFYISISKKVLRRLIKRGWISRRQNQIKKYYL